jgi:tRNA(Arg) A34 adenosine deaminase TadA
MNQTDIRLLRAAIEVAKRSVENGNMPFGAVLADKDGNVVLEGDNTSCTERDCTGHAETNLMRDASRRFDAEFLATCTLYTSAEPCAMCAGAIFWGNVGRVVYALGIDALYEIIQEHPDNPSLRMHASEVFDLATKNIELLGPAPELHEEASAIHRDYWSSSPVHQTPEL